MSVGEKTAQNKLAGRTDFTYPEFRKTCTLLFEYNADYLFAEKLTKEKLCDKEFSDSSAMAAEQPR